MITTPHKLLKLDILHIKRVWKVEPFDCLHKESSSMTVGCHAEQMSHTNPSIMLAKNYSKLSVINLNTKIVTHSGKTYF
jgi:hypothetical protein